jgi:hypothetical protein
VTAEPETGVSRTVRYQGTVELVVEDTQRWRNNEVTLATIERETDELVSHARQYLAQLLAWGEKQRKDGIIGVPTFGGRIRFGQAQRTAVAVIEADQ